MRTLMKFLPQSPAEGVTEVLHGVRVTDPYRWLEDQDSPRTREWLEAQMLYARTYLDSVPGRENIRSRIRELLDVEAYDSLQKFGNRYIFRRRLPGKEQPCICMREGFDGEDQVLIDPAQRGTGPYAAVKPLFVSPNGRLLLYEVKDGGERTGTFEVLDIQARLKLADLLPRGYLRGFSFTPDSQGFYYVHEARDSERPNYRAVWKHMLGTTFAEDQEVFFAGDEPNLRLGIVPGPEQLGFIAVRFMQRALTDFYLWPFESGAAPEPVIRSADYKFVPLLLNGGRILAMTDHGAPNARIVEVRPRKGADPELMSLIPETDLPIQNWTVCGERIFVSYLRRFQTEIEIFDLSGKSLGQLPTNQWETVRLLGSSQDGTELFFEQESFTRPVQIYSYSWRKVSATQFAGRKTPTNSQSLGHMQVWFPAGDGTPIPMFLVGRREVLAGGSHPAIATSYGGFGVSMTPQFSVFVTFLMERGCLFALPNIRGGSEFGAEWHNAATRRNRHVALDDFLAAVEWLIDTGKTSPEKLAIFGGSNSGLLVGAAMTQRPDLFRAVVCMVPLLDMLRYHLFDGGQAWREEFGTADDAEDFSALFRFSPYQQVRDGVAYPATMIVSGDSDQNCNPLHARKMTARLQAANASEYPILLDYSRERGHSPVMPLSARICALTDRMAFLCDQLQLEV